MTTNAQTEAVIQKLKERLSIRLDFNESGNAYYDSSHHSLKAVLLLDDEEISSSEVYLPNHHRDSNPY